MTWICSHYFNCVGGEVLSIWNKHMLLWQTATFQQLLHFDTKCALLNGIKGDLRASKNPLKQDLSPVIAKLDKLTNRLSEIYTTVKLLLGKFDALLNQLKDINKKVTSHMLDIAKVKEELKIAEKLTCDTSFEVEEIAQYLRRDCLEVTGVTAKGECQAEAITKSIGDVIGTSCP